MSKATETEYFEARTALNGAVAAFIKAAYAIGKDNEGIAGDIEDSVFDASKGDIPVERVL